MKNPNFQSRLSFGARLSAYITAVVVMIGILAVMTFTQAATTPPVPIDVAKMLPALNSAGDHVYAEMYINDSTGVVTTPNDAGVYTAITASPLTAGETDGSGCITASVSTGKFTVAARCGVGEAKLTACITNVAGSSNTAQTTQGAWHKNGTIISASPKLMRTEPVDAGGSQNDFGCSSVIVDLALDDYVQFMVTNPGGGLTVTSRQASFRVEKMLDK